MRLGKAWAAGSLSLAALALFIRIGAASAAEAVDGFPGVALSTDGFRGENCRRCHELMRDRLPGPVDSQSPPIAAGRYDVVIVGGGLSGLAAAHYLKDFKILILDPEPSAGMQVRRDRFDTHPYPVSTNYASIKAPAWKIKELFRSLRIKPERVSLLTTSLNAGGTVTPDWLAGDPEGLPYPEPVQERFDAMQKFLKSLEKSGKLSIPVERSQPQALAQYDRDSFRQFIDNTYGSDAADMADLYSRGVFGVPAEEISAAAGLQLLASELGPRYTWDGGLGGVSEALSKELAVDLSTGAFVWNVTQDQDGVAVDFSQDGRDYEARARAAVLALPSFVVKRIAAGLNEDKLAALSRVRYSAFAVEPLRIKTVLWKDSFSYWTAGRFLTNLDVPVPDAEPLIGTTEQILIANAPLGEAEGRKELLAASDAELTAKVLTDLDGLFPGGSSEVAEARVIRWGHALPIPFPGYLTQIRPAIAKPQGRYFFAGVDTQLPTFEGAVYSGIAAADEVRDFLKTRESGAPASPR